MKLCKFFIVFGLTVRIISGFYTGCMGRIIGETVPGMVYLVHTQCVKDADVYTFYQNFDLEQIQSLREMSNEDR
jgi:hypothetical protein